MAADPMSVVCIIEEQLQDVENIPAENTAVITRWDHTARGERRAAVVNDRGHVIGYLSARHDAITSIVCCRGVVTIVRRGDDPSVMVQLTVPR